MFQFDVMMLPNQDPLRQPARRKPVVTKTEGTGNEVPLAVVVTEAGVQGVNGTYYRDGRSAGAWKYTKDGRTQRFTIYKCMLEDGTYQWHIGIVPDGNNPGTSADIVFYTVPYLGDAYPPYRFLPLPPLASNEKEDGGFDRPKLDYVAGGGQPGVATMRFRRCGCVTSDVFHSIIYPKADNNP